MIMVFTMKDVPESLDLVLLSSEGKVIYTTTMEPGARGLFSYNEPARIALEFRKGLIRRAQIRLGQDIFSRKDIATLSQICRMNPADT